MITDYTETDIIDYLESRGLQPEFSPNKTRFRHPQRLSRIAIINHNKGKAFTLRFSNPMFEFIDRWKLSPEGELPVGIEMEELKVILDDFFFIEPNNTNWALTFEERLPEIKEILQRHATRQQRTNNYELSYEDLYQIASIKAYEIYCQYGDKPTFEFQCLISRSIERRIASLLSKHYVSKCRTMEMVSLSTEMGDIIPEILQNNELDPADWEEYTEKLNKNERILLESVIHPSPVLRRDNFIENLRFKHIKAQSPKKRIPLPKYKLNKIARVSDISVEELETAYTNLSSTIKSSAWEELIEVPNATNDIT
jgi:Asp-tRNA(Asn)/Glu-tRNA(Gln) amidotransferase C subunit